MTDERREISYVRPGPRQGCPYDLLTWCHDCRYGRHDPMTCTGGEFEKRYGPFRDAEDATAWLERAAIYKRPPTVFELENVESGERTEAYLALGWSL